MLRRPTSLLFLTSLSVVTAASCSDDDLPVDGTGGTAGLAGASTGGSAASGGEPSGGAPAGGTHHSGGKANLGGAAGFGGESILEVWSACAHPEETPEFVRPPRFAESEGSLAPLVGSVEFETDTKTSGWLTLSGGGEEWELALDNAYSHEKLILGLKPDTQYQARISLECASGDQTNTQALTWTTPALPADFPPLAVLESKPEQMEPGMTLFAVREAKYLVVVDAAGNVRWFYQAPLKLSYDFAWTPRGTLLFIPDGRSQLREIDLRGHAVASWHAANLPVERVVPTGSTPVAVESFHHSLFEMPNGNLLSLGSSGQILDNYSTSSTDPDAPTETAHVIGDVIVEFTRSGELVKEIPLLELLDPRRISHGALGSWWNGYYGDSRDWSHSNTVLYDAASDAFLVSVRHQDAIFKIDRQSESLVWIMGTPSNWQAPWSDLLLAPVGDLLWPSHQHGLELTPGGIGMFDNGNFRAAAFEEPQTPTYSRAVRYRIDEQARTVSQEWSYGQQTGAASFYGSAMGDADYYPASRNTLVTVGSQKTDTDPSYAYVDMREVTAAGNVVFHMHVRSEPEVHRSYTAYDAERIADIRFALE